MDDGCISHICESKNKSFLQPANWEPLFLQDPADSWTPVTEDGEEVLIPSPIDVW